MTNILYQKTNQLLKDSNSKVIWLLDGIEEYIPSTFAIMIVLQLARYSTLPLLFHSLHGMMHNRRWQAIFASAKEPFKRELTKFITISKKRLSLDIIRDQDIYLSYGASYSQSRLWLLVMRWRYLIVCIVLDILSCIVVQLFNSR